MRYYYRTKKKAFSLLELLIVIAILGILFIVLASKIDFVSDKSRTSGLQADMRAFQMALHTVGAENQGYTEDLNELVLQINKNLNPKMHLSVQGAGMVSALSDPWGKPYFISYAKTDEDLGRIIVTSHGPDGFGDTADDSRMVVTYQITSSGGIIVVDSSGASYCDHIYGNWASEKTATCLSEGQEYRTCGQCKVRQTRILNQTGHVIDEHGVCSVCNKNFIAGLYMTGTDRQIMSWDQLLSASIMSDTGSASNASSAGVPAEVADRLSGDLILPYSITTIPAYAFNGCVNLTSITIPDGCTAISDYAFSGCSSLKSITIPDTVTYIGSYAFNGCDQITNIKLPDDVSSIKDGTFWGCQKLSNIEFSNQVTEIGDNAFYNCTSLSKVILPANLITLGRNVFYGCTSLSNIQFGNLLQSIGDSAFAQCSALTRIALPNSIQTIGSQVFSGCDYLSTVVLPINLIDIPNQMFYNCIRLSTVTLPSNLRTIGSYAFYGCKKLSNISLPSSLNLIRYSAFNGCTNLKKVNYDGEISDWCKIDIQDQLAAPTYFAKDLYIQGSLVTSALIESETTGIGNFAFINCKSLSNVRIEEGVTNIGSYAFANCSNLDNVVIANSVNFVGTGVFQNCTALTTITLGTGISHVSEQFLSGCSNITSLIIAGNLSSIGTKAFDCSKLNLISYYGTIDNWNNIAKADGWISSSNYSVVCADGTA